MEWIPIDGKNEPKGIQKLDYTDDWMECRCLVFVDDPHPDIRGWYQGRFRKFSNGKRKFLIENAFGKFNITHFCEVILPSVTARTIRYSYRQQFACKCCGNVPDEKGELEHGRGCYALSEDGGGCESIEFPPSDCQCDHQLNCPVHE